MGKKQYPNGIDEIQGQVRRIAGQDTIFWDRTEIIVRTAPITYLKNGNIQSRSRFTLSTALDLPFSFSVIRRIDSSIVLRSMLAFRRLSNTRCLAAISSDCSCSSSSMLGTESGGFLTRGERNGWDWGNVESLDAIVSECRKIPSCRVLKHGPR